jgi:hypothetical protein
MKYGHGFEYRHGPNISRDMGSYMDREKDRDMVTPRDIHIETDVDTVIDIYEIKIVVS